MGAIKSKIFDDSATLDHESLKPGEMTKMRQNDQNMGLASAQYVTNQPERIQNTLIDKVQDINLDGDKKEITNSGMQSASAASFQPPDFLQRSQYFRSFRSASRRFFGKKDHADDSISKISKENEASTGNNIPSRNYFYRSFKNSNRNNLNCISNLKNERENLKGETQPSPEMKSSWFKNLKSRSNADFRLKNSLNEKNSNEIINEEKSKFPNNKSLASKSFNAFPTRLGLSLVEIDADEIKVKKRPEPRPEINSQSSNSSSSSSAGIFSRQSNGSINNSKSFDQFNNSVQIPIKILKDQQSFKQKQQSNYINSVFLNELNALNDFSKNNDSIIDKLKSEVEILNRLLDVFDRDDPKVINELIFKTDNLASQAQKLQTEVKEHLKIKNKNNQMNRFTSEVVIKLYEECIIRLDRQLEILVTQIKELASIKQFLVQVASDYNQQSQYSSSSSSYGYSDSYYSSSSSDGYYPNYPNYHPRNNYYYSSRTGYPPHYYVHPNPSYIHEQPTAYYFTYRTPQQTNLFYDTVSGQYFYRKPHVHVHPHSHPHPANQYYPTQSGPYQRNSQNFFHSTNEPNSQSKPNDGVAIITEVSDDEDDYLRNISEKKKDYVDAISLKEDE